MKMDLFDSPPLQQTKSTARAEGRSLPFSEDGEKGVLCSLLLSPRDVLDLCQIKLRPEAFYTPAHQILFNLVAELVDSNKPIDFITLKQALKDRAQLDEIGGPEYLSDLFQVISDASHWLRCSTILTSAARSTLYPLPALQPSLPLGHQ